MSRSPVSLAHLSVIDAHPLALIDAAVAGGFDDIGLRLVSPDASDPLHPVVGDEALVRQIRQRLADAGLGVLDVESFWLAPHSRVEDFLPALDVAARLGAQHVLVVGNDPSEARVTARFARLCELAQPFGLKVMLEFIPYCRTRSIGEAHRVVGGAAQANGGVLVDALQLKRSGGTPQQVSALDPAWLAYCQLCDAHAERPAPDRLRHEARHDRLYPGQGALALVELLDALPPGIPIAIEAPHALHAALPVVERGRLCGQASRAFLDAYERRVAATTPLVALSER